MKLHICIHFLKVSFELLQGQASAINPEMRDCADWVAHFIPSYAAFAASS